jgi:regulator of protease activity HflC (stomatin/prohibitin superfamily)
MKKLIFTMALAVVTALSFTSCERVDAGHEGILVDLYGSDRGVNDVSLVTGMVYYNPFTQNVYEYPTFVQTVDYPAFTINAKDGSEFTVDPTISLKIIDG